MMALLGRLTTRPSVRFLIVGGINFVLVYIAYLAALPHWGHRNAYWLAVAVGIVFTTIMNIRHTFSRQLSLPALAVYGVYYYLYALAHVAMIAWLIEDLGFPAEPAPLVTLVCLTPIHFLLSRSLIQRIAPALK